MGATQRMRCSPRGARPTLKARTAVMNDTVARDHADAETLERGP
jgi:hypothetical protein